MGLGNDRRRKITRYNRNNSFADRQSGRAAERFADMRMWCKGKSWVSRLVVVAWFEYIWIRMMRDPNYYVIFDPINLGIHEFGHYTCMPFGRFMMFLRGSMNPMPRPACFRTRLLSPA